MSLLNVNSSNTLFIFFMKNTWSDTIGCNQKADRVEVWRTGSNLFFFVSTFYDYFSFRQLREKGLLVNIIDMYCKNEYKIC